MYSFNIIRLLLISLIFLMGSCSRLLEIDTPRNQIVTTAVFRDSLTAQSAIVNVYAYTGAISGSAGSSYYHTISLYVDDYALTSFNSSDLPVYQGILQPDDTGIKNIWTRFYFVIYSCNDILEQIANNNILPASFRDQLEGEAKFLRAHAYFYLVNLFDRIPLILKTDVNQNRLAPQVSAEEVYNQVEQDLKDAQRLLAGKNENAGKVRATEWSATALLARVLLYRKQYAAAEKEATSVIASGHFLPLDDPSNVFTAESREAILQLWTQNGYIPLISSLVPDNAASTPGMPMTESLYASFDTDDKRREHWTGYSTVISPQGDTTVYHYAHKYENREQAGAKTEYVMTLRLSEVLLIRAECRLFMNDIPGAVDDLNVIRNRAGIIPLEKDITNLQCMDAILDERRRELFGEWGHRFTDLKRTNRLNEVMKAAKSTWRTDTSAVLPIPQDEITYDPNLVQNKGYF